MADLQGFSLNLTKCESVSHLPKQAVSFAVSRRRKKRTPLAGQWRIR
jgi:hypothetical protein